METYKTSTAGGEFDSYNNVEQVWLNSLPVSSTYAVHVYARNVPVGAPQQYSLVVSGAISIATCSISFDSYADRICPNQCSGKGQCNTNGFCNCTAGYQGLDCSLSPCPYTNGRECAGNGFCDFSNSSCVCGLNFAPPACTAQYAPASTNQTLATGYPPAPASPYTAGLLAGLVIAAFIVGSVISVFLGGYLAVRYLEYRRDKAMKEKSMREEEMK